MFKGQQIELQQGGVPLLAYAERQDKLPVIVNSRSGTDEPSLDIPSIKQRKSKKERKREKRRKKEEKERKLLNTYLQEQQAKNTYDASILPLMNTLIRWTPTSISQVCFYRELQFVYPPKIKIIVVFLFSYLAQFTFFSFV